MIDSLITSACHRHRQGDAEE
eukprot:COSAG06_NODE_20037_length_811_cov_1476.313202_2_plen_20_part_01